MRAGSGTAGGTGLPQSATCATGSVMVLGFSGPKRATDRDPDLSYQSRLQNCQPARKRTPTWLPLSLCDGGRVAASPSVVVGMWAKRRRQPLEWLRGKGPSAPPRLLSPRNGRGANAGRRQSTSPPFHRQRSPLLIFVFLSIIGGAQPCILRLSPHPTPVARPGWSCATAANGSKPARIDDTGAGPPARCARVGKHPAGQRLARAA